MSFTVILLLAEALLHVAATPDPLVTPAPIQVTPENLHLILAREHELHERASSSFSWNTDGENFCYGQPSICGESNNLSDECQKYSNQEEYTKYFACLCTNGAVAAEIACYWCNLAFDTGFALIDDFLPSICITSLSTTIAPIPSSVLAILSSLNATYTGTLPTGLGSGYSGITAITNSNIAGAASGPNSGANSVGNPGTNPGPASTSAAITPTVKSGGSSESSISENTLFGLSTGGSSVLTFNGGGGGETETTAPPLVSNTGSAPSLDTSSPPKAGAGTRGAQGLHTGVGVASWIVVFVLTVLCLL